VKFVIRAPARGLTLSAAECVRVAESRRISSPKAFAGGAGATSTRQTSAGILVEELQSPGAQNAAGSFTVLLLTFTNVLDLDL